jgi:4-carboxymuconolactone decarboxylase
MARVPLIREKSQIAAEHQDIFDMIASTRGEVAGPFPLLLHDPLLAGKIAELGSHIRFGSPLSGVDQKILVLVVAAETGSRYLTSFHTPLARKLGIDEATIAAIAEKGIVTGRDSMLIDYTRKLLRAQPVEKPLFDAMEERFGTPALTTLTATIGYYAMLAYLMNAFELTA